jgi:hypothetical protein
VEVSGSLLDNRSFRLRWVPFVIPVNRTMHSALLSDLDKASRATRSKNVSDRQNNRKHGR